MSKRKNKDSKHIENAQYFWHLDFFFWIKSYRLDAMHLEWAPQVVLTPFIPAHYSSPVIYTHKRVDAAEQGECSVVTQHIHIH